MLQPMQHTVLFSRRSLRMALQSAGFSVVHIGAARKTLTLSYLAGQLASCNPALTHGSAVVEHLLPEALTRRPVSINIGELMALAVPS
jgi:hypothetical protein